MKIYLYFTVFSLFLLSATCKNGSSSKAVPGKLEGALAACNGDSLRLFSWNGILLDPIQVAPLVENDNSTHDFSFKIEGLPNGLYFIGQNPKVVRPFLIYNEKGLRVAGRCDSIQTLQFLDYQLDADYQEMMNLSTQLQNEFQSIIGQYRRARGNAQTIADLNAKMADVDKRKLELYESTKQKSPYLGKILGLTTYTSFQSADKTNYDSEGKYFAENFFKYVDFSDPDYNNLPQLMQSGQAYSQTLASVGLTSEVQAGYIDGILGKMSEGSAHQSFLLGICLGYGKTKEEVNLVKYSELYLDQYGGQNQQLEEMLNGQIRKAKKLMVGVEAPEIALNTPEGKEKKLSDYKGKVVLIDFWASWCGPCRKENPNVVKVYNKYKTKGFEIFAVSLDKKQDRWLAAIEKDGLTWPHVSDLKGWASTAAKSYGVSSIPQTFLIDQEGKIIAKNLRGPTLEAKLAELFE